MRDWKPIKESKMKYKKRIIMVIRTLYLVAAVYLSVRWFGVIWWQAWIVSGLFAISATLHLAREEE
jgi:fatty acid desaturase